MASTQFISTHVKLEHDAQEEHGVKLEHDAQEEHGVKDVRDRIITIDDQFIKQLVQNDLVGYKFIDAMKRWVEDRQTDHHTPPKWHALGMVTVVSTTQTMSVKIPLFFDTRTHIHVLIDNILKLEPKKSHLCMDTVVDRRLALITHPMIKHETMWDALPIPFLAMLYSPRN